MVDRDNLSISANFPSKGIRGRRLSTPSIYTGTYPTELCCGSEALPSRFLEVSRRRCPTTEQSTSRPTDH